MMATPVSAADAVGSQLGINFQSLLQIILTQLTAQDPLKPLDNFQFVSQLAQFSQLQLSDQLNSEVTSLLSAQAAEQAVGLLGRTIDVTTGQTGSSTTLTGVVQAVGFSTGAPQ